MKMPSAIGSAVLLGVLVASTSASAQPGGGMPAAVLEAPAPIRQWAVTISPVHLAVGPIGEVTVEKSFGPKIGAAVMIGVGQFTDSPAFGAENTFRVFEAGLSGRYYALGSYRAGMQVGASIEFVTLSGDNVNNSNVSAIGNGVSVSPFLGYKHTWAMGLTFDGQLGPSFLAVKAKADDGSTAEESDVGVNLNLNLGWSF